jgi:serine/threonine-protein kinase
MSETGSATSRIRSILFTDIVDSVGMKRRLGDTAYLRLLERHNNSFRAAIAAEPGGLIIKSTGDGYLASFESASMAARTALRFLAAISAESGDPDRISVRVAIHSGQTMEITDPDGVLDLIGYSVDITARVMGLAEGGQILLTRHAFDDARQFVREHPILGAGELAWLAHGPYRFAGSDDDPLEVFEVGVQNVSPLRPPQDSPKARRSVAPDEEELFAWRPAIGGEIPHRAGWRLQSKLGEGGFGEVWLARHSRTKQQRVFKFCFDVDRLRSFKRELTLFRLLQQALGERNDIAQLFEVNLERPPYSLESEYSPLGDLGAWADTQGGVRSIPFEQRIDLLAGIAEAVAAAHSVGILHKDIKPSNVLIEADGAGAVRPKITDFGIGVLTDMSLLEQHRITVAGFTVSQLTENDSSRTGTRLYAPPELLTRVRTPGGVESPAPFTAQGDVYALGVLLFQLVVGDLSRPLASGWERSLDEADLDPDLKDLLRADIGEMVDGDPSRRVQTASEVADRLRSIDQRLAEQLAQKRAARAEDRRRNALRFAVGAGAALAILLVAATVFLQRERSLRHEAERQRAHAEDTLEFVEEFLINSPQTEDLGRNARMVTVLADASRALAARFSAEPFARASMHATLGGAYLWLGELQDARQELTIAIDHFGGEDAAATHERGRQALLQLSEALWRSGLAAESLEPVHWVLAARSTALGENHPLTLEATTSLAHALKWNRQFDESQLAYEQVLDRVSRKSPPPQSQIIDLRYHIGLVHLARAGVLAAEDEKNKALDQAAAVFRRVVEEQAAFSGDNSLETAYARSELAQTLSRRKAFDGAEELFASSLDALGSHLGRDHWRTCQARANLAAMYYRQERFAEAESLYRESLAGYRSTLGPDSDRAINTTRILALTLGKLNRPAEGLQMLADLRAEVGDDKIDADTLAKVVSASTALQKQLADATATAAD